MMDSRLARHATAVAVGLLLAACGGGGSGGNDNSGGTAAPSPSPTGGAPTVTLSAMPASIAPGANTTLNWTSTNASACAASDGWSGNKMTSGSQAFTALAQTTTFTLTCSGAGGTGTQSVQINVGAGQAPSLAFSAAPMDVSVNGTSMLSWSALNATSCAASGAWSGAKGTTDNEIVGPLSTSSTFTLTCTGPGGPPVQKSVIVTVSGASTSGGVSGRVDSSLIDSRGGNQVYVFNGMVTPRDTQGGSGDAAFKLAVNQDPNACTFGYALPSLAMGTYTLAFTSQGQVDRPTQADAITFNGTMTVVVGNQPVRRDFRPASLLQVGPSRQFRTIAAAAAAANPGTVIEVDAGVYPNDVVVWGDDGVVVRGVGGRPSVQGTQTIAFVPSDDRRNGKGIWVVAADRMRIENFEISGARVSDGNGAAIRNEGRDLTICNSFLHDNENGFLGGAFGTLTMEYSIFAFNGAGEGQTHNVYVDEGSAVGDRLIFRHNYSHHARIGHNLKTRARENFVLYNRIMDEADGTASYAIDFSDGGIAYVIGNLLQQGPSTDNPEIVAFNLENLDGRRPQELYLINNTLVNDLGSGGFVNARGTTSTFRSVNNLFVGAGTLYRNKQPALVTNLQSQAAALLSALNFDYRLNSGVAAINAGSNPGSVPGVSLIPDFQYVHPARREVRNTAGSFDVGAYEAGP
jgi:hypothetical protein